MNFACYRQGCVALMNYWLYTGFFVLWRPKPYGWQSFRLRIPNPQRARGNPVSFKGRIQGEFICRVVYRWFGELQDQELAIRFVGFRGYPFIKWFDTAAPSLEAHEYFVELRRKEVTRTNQCLLVAEMLSIIEFISTRKRINNKKSRQGQWSSYIMGLENLNIDYGM